MTPAEKAARKICFDFGVYYKVGGEVAIQDLATIINEAIAEWAESFLEKSRHLEAPYGDIDYDEFITNAIHEHQKEH